MKPQTRRSGHGRFCLKSLALCLPLILAALGVTAVTAAPAMAFTGTNVYTYNRPSTVELGSAEYMAWADQSIDGQVFVTKLSSNGTKGPVWTDSSIITYNGTGPTIAGSNGELAVAWTDQSGAIWLAETTGGAGGGFQCASAIVDGGAAETPYLTSEGDDGTGRLFLTWADVSGTMSVDTINVPKPGPGCQFSEASNDLITTGDSTWDGPAMVVAGYGTASEHYWLMWAGTGSTHYLNIAEYDSNWNRIAKHTETNHATLTDMSGADLTAGGSIWMSYCGTNHAVYYQEFTTVNGGPETQVPFGAQCDIDLYQGFYSGGVGISYEYSSGLMLLSWADRYSYQVDQDTT